MIIYLSGNFPVMNDQAKEEGLKEITEKLGFPNYNRCISFWFAKDAVNVLKIKEKEANGGDL